MWFQSWCWKHTVWVCLKICTQWLKNKLVPEAWAQFPTPALYTLQVQDIPAVVVVANLSQWQVVNSKGLISELLGVHPQPVRILCSLICGEHLLWTHQLSSSTTHRNSGSGAWSLSEDENPRTPFVLNTKPSWYFGFIAFLYHKLVSF